MAKFCTNCGRPLADGETCGCARDYRPMPERQQAQGLWEAIKNHMGIGDPELNRGDAFERDKLIVPDCVKANEGEVSVKQYDVALLRNRILWFAYSKAMGRVQVTNKRVIFRAPGRCYAGRTSLQHEFDIDDVAGLEARREYVYNPWDLLLGILVALIGGGLIFSMITAMFMNGYGYSTLGVSLFTLIIGVAGCVPFFMLKKKWLLKLLCLGGSTLSLLGVGSAISYRSGFGGFLMFLGVITLLFAIFCLFIYSIKPNLVLVIKTKIATEAISIRRHRRIPFKLESAGSTGYTEVIPMEGAEMCIREINAVINDIKEHGDKATAKWSV